MENMKINIPSNWNEISLGTYQEIANIKAASDITRLQETIHILADVNITTIPVTELKKITAAISWMNILPNEKELKKVITVDGSDYGLIEKFESFTLGEWVDLEEYNKDVVNNLHKIMAILYRPIVNEVIEGYNADTMEERASLFEEKMMIGDVYATMIFFFITGLNFTQIFQTSLINQL